MHKNIGGVCSQGSGGLSEREAGSAELHGQFAVGKGAAKSKVFKKSK